MFSQNAATVLSSFAATVSAVAAIYAIKQSVLQRRLSYKPQLHIEDYLDTVHMINMPHFDYGLSSQRFMGYYELPIINIGNGAAQNIKYEWEYNLHHSMNKISELFKELSNLRTGENKNYNFFHSFEKVGDGENIIFEEYGTYKRFPTTYNYNLQYILSNQDGGSTTNIRLPAILCSIIFNIINLTNQSGKKIKSFKGPKLIFSYQDSGGAFITEYFESEFIPGANELSSMHTKHKIRIKFNKLDNRWTVRLLQRIRKSYVDFMIEHDFNKNK